ncbi:MAG: Arc family DNA binding domain-containing protein [Bacteroidota bacterium]|nr:Arc family DNA binding domain-containing protein [Bacteroidota bacterium]
MKKKFVLRVDEDVYNALEKWASDEFRSANGQIEWLLVHQLKLNGRYKQPRYPGLKDEESTNDI